MPSTAANTYFAILRIVSEPSCAFDSTSDKLLIFNALWASTQLEEQQQKSAGKALKS